MEVIVDCMSCLVTGVLTPVSFRDACGIVHRVRWSTHSGPYLLCDFDEEGKPREGARPIRSVNELIAMEEP